METRPGQSVRKGVLQGTHGTITLPLHRTSYSQFLAGCGTQVGSPSRTYRVLHKIINPLTARPSISTRPQYWHQLQLPVQVYRYSRTRTFESEILYGPLDTHRQYAIQFFSPSVRVLSVCTRVTCNSLPIGTHPASSRTSQIGAGDRHARVNDPTP